MFKLQIETDNDAFCNPRDEQNNDEERGAELARLLRRVAGQIQAGGMSGSCHDVNGNKVGTWEVSP